MENPTKKQKELLNFIDGFIKGNGYAPSYREIMRALDYKSVSTVATHVDSLITRGWLVKRNNEARTLEVVLLDKPIVNQTINKNIDTETLINAKIKELSKNAEQNTDSINILTKALEILGYTPKRN